MYVDIEYRAKEIMCTHQRGIECHMIKYNSILNTLLIFNNPQSWYKQKPDKTYYNIIGFEIMEGEL